MKIEGLSEQQAAEIAGWRYAFPYEWYDTASDPRRIERAVAEHEGKSRFIEMERPA